MKWIYSIDRLPQPDALVIGGKGMALMQMADAGLPVPAPLCISTAAYDLFVDTNHLREKIGLELYRKNIRDMRWEEIWDASLRIQLLFLKGKISGELKRNILETIRDKFGDQPLVIRSSAPEEDGAGGSFAGLHDSYINVSGSNEIIRKIKKVWASLWSDRAILYRQELGLEVLKSRMAVVVQPFIEGQVSGILFTQNPLDEQQMVVEAVHGLNQGLVDGAVAPDRWLINRQSLRVEAHKAPEKRDTCFVRSSSGGLITCRLDSERSGHPPLEENLVDGIVRLGRRVEDHYRVPQDIEWTLADEQWCILQARPITAGSESTQGDKRAWYLSLTRSYQNLLDLRDRITQKLLPEMDEDSARLAAVNFDEMGDTDLALELRRRSQLNERWTAVYWSDFIPFAHGVRLFGEVYNDLIEPDDPFEFVILLTGQKMLSTERNDLLKGCAKLASADNLLRQSLKGGVLKDAGGEEFQSKVSRLRSHFSIDFVGGGDPQAVDKIISSMILQYSLLASESRATSDTERKRLEREFLGTAERKIELDPAELLSMARESYRIRDDDNIHIGRIGQELERACEYARARLHGSGSSVPQRTSALNLALVLEGKTVAEGAAEVAETEKPKGADHTRVRARQLQGQPASRGIASGTARVVKQMTDLSEFKKGEVLVIDSIDPTMTFFAPLAAAIIERRGGMLIHGAIIAREYGIPCITGVVGATDHISTGDRITVDGYLGICTVQRHAENITTNFSEAVC
ncbi:MAG: PEP/pyruvate-binding domain-containing protein [Desulfocapsaceae bacterium]